MKKTLSIVGGGAASLFLAACLDPERFVVNLYEQNAAPGRKFLVAGDGGLNLTHSEPPEVFIQRYHPPGFLQEAFRAFSNRDFINWLQAAGIETRVGSSGRVFPAKGLKPIDVLNILLNNLKQLGVNIYTRHEWIGFTTDNHLRFRVGGKILEVTGDYTVFSLGGASWPVTGSTGGWTGYFREKGISVLPFEASNCAFLIPWPAALSAKIAGKPLKNISISCSGKTHAGEVVLTASGMEGSGIYPLSPQIRSQINDAGFAEISVDLKPSLSPERLLEKITKARSEKNFSAGLTNELNLSAAQLALIKHLLTREQFLNPLLLARALKDLRLRITGTAPISEAISTVGGIALEETDTVFQLQKIPGVFTIGEMLDYDAPTGGYLLQSCFTMARFLAQHLNNLPGN